MFCTRCGANNLDTDQFCRSCGATLVKSGAQGASPGAQSPSSGSAQPPYPYSTPNAGQQQQQPQGYTPYPGYQGYPPPQYGYANQMSGQQGAGASGRAIASLVLGIISILMCCAPVSIVGIVLGKMEMNAIEEGRAPRAGEGMAKVGFYLGIVATALSLLVYGLYFLGALASIAGSNY
jgi:hypothetical protein